MLIPSLCPTLKAEGYELLMRSRPSHNYDVMEGSKLISQIHVDLKLVEANTGTQISYVPYDADIRVVEGRQDLPLEIFKKIILATVSMS